MSDDERIPDAFRNPAPPKDLQQAITEGKRPCGTGRFGWAWNKGPSKGLPVSVYCSEPLCLRTGTCTGPRFVPHLAQYKHIEDDGTPGPPRHLTAAEALTASRFGAQMAREETGVRDERSDAEVLAHIEEVRERMRRSIFGQ